jgi:cytochrome d ubiquinol oxidase subunit I
VSTLDLSRWQFGITTVYHFIFVPLTIGLGVLVAMMQTAWVRTGGADWLRMTRYFGKLFLITFAMGIVTGIVQEFQFGMNWSVYSQFVGDVFGAPLALEALIAFFLESTFLGLWIFGWDRLPRLVHLAALWLAAIGSVVSAYFIIAANSFMQHPVGVVYNPVTARAELDSLLAVLASPTAVMAFAHTIAASFVVAGTFVAGIAGWRAVTAATAGDAAEAGAYRPALRLGLAVLVAAGIGVAVTGDAQGKMMFEHQPMKMAAAEALCTTERGAGLSVIAVGDPRETCDITQITIPRLASLLATGDPDAELRGVRELQADYSRRFGEGTYIPLVPAVYWTFRLMMGFGAVSAVLALAGLWTTRRGAVPASRWFGRLALAGLPMPFLACATGWIFTETGRQPWIVAPNLTGDDTVRLRTEDAVSPYVDTASVMLSLAVFTLLYGALAVVWLHLMRRVAASGAPPAPSAPPPGGEDTPDDEDPPLTFAY